jgi:hypothetical protein
MRPGTRPAGSANRRGRRRRRWARSRAGQAAGAGRPGGGSGASPQASGIERQAIHPRRFRQAVETDVEKEFGRAPGHRSGGAAVPRPTCLRNGLAHPPGRDRAAPGPVTGPGVGGDGPAAPPRRSAPRCARRPRRSASGVTRARAELTMTTRLQRTIAITGAASGIGAATVHRLRSPMFRFFALNASLR